MIGQWWRRYPGIGFLVGWGLLAWGFASPVAAADADPTSPRAAVIQMNGAITPMLEQFVYRSLDRAHDAGCSIVIVEIDSPGGYVTSSFQLAERFQQVAWGKVVAYVPREALSGASIAALGCPEIYLREQARFGDAGPIYYAEDGAFRHVPEKLRSDLALRMRQLAEHYGRPPTLAEAFVDSDLKVFEVRHKETKEVRFLAQKEIDALPDPQDWEVGAPVVESGDGRFLELSGKRAVELGLATGNVSSREELLQRLGVKEPPLVISPTAGDHLVAWLNHPLITGLLFVIGLVALYIELSAPGIGMGAAVSGLCFALFFWSRFLGGTAGWLEVILFLSGIAFLLLEFFVLPGFGVCGLTGLLLMVVSLILASQNFVIPHTPAERQQLAVSTSVIVGAGFVFLGCAVFITRHLGRLPILNRLVLQAPSGDSLDANEFASEDDLPGVVKVGAVGVADSPLRPAGKAVFGDEFVDVVTDGSFVESGRPVRVIKVNGNRIVVREIEADRA